MSYMKEPKSSKFDRDPAASSPLNAAISAQDRDTLAMVASALKDRRMRLAFQPVVYAADTSLIGFFEGFIRLLNLRDQVIPARDFMGAVEQRQLGRDIDCAALQLGLMAMQRNPQIRVSINMSARSVGYRPWMDILNRALQDNSRLGSSLILEINEESALQVPDVLKPFMAEMREHKIVFALDDFGAGMTSVRFARMIKRIYGVSPMQLITKTRITAGSRLLRETDASIAQIALDCGFADHSAFTRSFRAVTGMSPTEHKRLNQAG